MRFRWSWIKSILCFLIFLELFFWAGGWVTRSVQSLDNNFRSTRKGVYRIMCIGESTTLVGGENSYPAQLEDILNENEPGRFQVINQGMAGVGTDIIAQRLPEWLKTYEPDMVIAMIGQNDSVHETKDSGFDFLKKLKTYAVFLFFQNQIQDTLNNYLNKLQKPAASPLSEKVKADAELDPTLSAVDEMSPHQKQIYLLIQLALSDGEYDIAEVLYEQFLEINNDTLVHNWVSKQYGVLLRRKKSYAKFVSKMENIPWDGWSMDWVKGYCHGEENMEHVASIIERMVQKGQPDLLYGYAASCYEEGGRKDLMEAILQKISKYKSSYYSEPTRKNYKMIKDTLIAKGVQPVFAQYPMRDIGPLLSIFQDSPDKEKIIFVDNGSIFQNAVSQSSYNDYFVDRTGGDHGHATPLGNRLLATNIARVIGGKK